MLPLISIFSAYSNKKIHFTKCFNSYQRDGEKDDVTMVKKTKYVV